MLEEVKWKPTLLSSLDAESGRSMAPFNLIKVEKSSSVSVVLRKTVIADHDSAMPGPEEATGLLCGKQKLSCLVNMTQQTGHDLHTPVPDAVLLDISAVSPSLISLQQISCFPLHFFHVILEDRATQHELKLTAVVTQTGQLHLITRQIPIWPLGGSRLTSAKPLLTFWVCFSVQQTPFLGTICR